MANLKNSNVWRGPQSGMGRTHVTTSIRIGEGTLTPESAETLGVECSFSLPVTTGRSKVHVVFGKSDFRRVLNTMVSVAPEEALAAMSKVLADQLAIRD